MASKCWFVLKQTHYPPPELPKNGRGKAKGPICLGHVIPDLKHLDSVINRHGPLDTPPDMPIYATSATNLTWDLSTSKGIDLSINSGVPIAAAGGLTIQLDAGVTFQRSVKNYWEFDSLDTFIIQPTGEYIEDSIEDDEVATYLTQRSFMSSSSLFMITGIMIARGAKITTSHTQQRGLNGGPGVGFAGIADAGIEGGASAENSISSTAQQTTDFVWAVRLAKISKGFLDRKWTHDTFSRGATFGLGQEMNLGTHLTEALEEEGFSGLKTPRIGPDDGVFIMQTDDEQGIEE